MVFLTPRIEGTMKFTGRFFLLLYFFVVGAQAFALNGNDNLELSLHSTATDPSGPATFTPWIVALIGFVLFGIILATLWPNDWSSNPYHRQRKFSRVDQLFLKVSGLLLSDLESRDFLKRGQREMSSALKKHLPEQITLLALSPGGCTLLGDDRLKRGMVVLLNLDTLPDFPSSELVAAVKIIWVREEKTHGKKYWVAGGKFLPHQSGSTSENLRQYLRYLMNEPAV